MCIDNVTDKMAIRTQNVYTDNRAGALSERRVPLALCIRAKTDSVWQLAR